MVSAAIDTGAKSMCPGAPTFKDINRRCAVYKGGGNNRAGAVWCGMFSKIAIRTYSRGVDSKAV